MRAAPILSLVFAVTMYSILTMVESRSATWYCMPCSGADCDKEPAEFCPWGETRNSCHRRVCAKGPGDRCGGFRDILGICGTGMWCQKDQEKNEHTCHGCFDNTLECYQHNY